MTYILIEIKQYIHDILYNSATWLFLIKKILSILSTIVIAMLSIRMIKSLIHRIFRLRYKATMLNLDERTMKKSKTIEKLLISIARYVIYFIAIVAILTSLGINITGLIAGAGLVSVAIGFGAQTLVKDIITGFFIALEDQFSVGDYIQIYNGSHIIAEGTVDSLGLRATKLKSAKGEEWFVPNSQIIQVLNKSMNFSRITIYMTIINESDIQNIKQQLHQYLVELAHKEVYQILLYGHDAKNSYPRLLGVESIEQNQITLTVVAEAKPMKNSDLQRRLTEDLLTFSKKYQLNLVALSNNLKK